MFSQTSEFSELLVSLFAKRRGSLETPQSVVLAFHFTFSNQFEAFRTRQNARLSCNPGSTPSDKHATVSTVH